MSYLASVKTLYLLRHAKSSWKEKAPSDLHRPLAPRGEKDARRIAQWMLFHGLKPQYIFSSTSVRTTQTLQRVLRTLRISAKQVRMLDGLYLAKAEALFAFVQQIDNRLDNVMLVGHNPGLSDLAVALCNEAPEELPTGALLGLELPIDSWEELTPHTAHLAFYLTPKVLRKKD